MNTFYERYRFRQISQKEGESVDQFAGRLRQQAEHCEFQDSEQNIIDQIIERCQNPRVRSKLLEKGNVLTLTKALSLARTVESVAVQSKEISEHMVNPKPAAEEAYGVREKELLNQHPRTVNLAAVT